MLVISRRIGESFVIGDNIIATVVDITGEKVVLGVEAPKEIPIERLDAAENPTGGRRARRRGK
ncbi:MAG: carbon storage regulator [Oscillospiraceae bacterium]|nr:carbon storage regulator [Oscillospiraceae bacterium]